MPLSVLNGGYKGEANAAPNYFPAASVSRRLLMVIVLTAEEMRDAGSSTSMVMANKKCAMYMALLLKW